MKLRKKPVVIVDPYPWITTAEVEELLAATAIYESSDGVVDVTENHFAAFRSLAWEAIENRKAVADMNAQVGRLTQALAEVGDERDSLAADFDSILGLEIATERRAQNAQWGGAEHDDTHARYEWPSFIWKFVQRARTFSFVNDATANDTYEANMVKIAALAVAAVQSSRRKRQCQAAVLTGEQPKEKA